MLTITRNPIFQAEIRHQWYVLENARSGRVWILLAVVMLLPALLTSLILFGRGLLGHPIIAFPNPNTPQTLPEQLLTFGSGLLVVMNIALYLVVMLISFGLASNSILREKGGKTWENLLLTNIHAGQIVWGKFMASLYALWGDHAMVALLRLGLVAYLLIGLEWRLVDHSVDVRVHLVILTVLLLLFTFLDVVMNTAISLFATLLDVPASVALAIFAALRVLTSAFAFWIIAETWRILFVVPGWHYIAAALAGMAVFTLLAFVMLRLAETAAVIGSQASPRPATGGMLRTTSRGRNG